VSNVTVAQRAGTKLVDIGYNLAADAAVQISIRLSANNGATWSVPTASLTGAVGTGITAGSGKAVVWDMGADWNGQHTTQLRAEITATPVYAVTFNLGAYGTRTGGGALSQVVTDVTCTGTSGNGAWTGTARTPARCRTRQVRRRARFA
jgi:hypothetical protein